MNLKVVSKRVAGNMVRIDSIGDLKYASECKSSACRTKLDKANNHGWENRETK